MASRKNTMLALLMLIAACGGGGGSGNANNVGIGQSSTNASPIAVIDPGISDYVAGQAIEFSSESSRDADGDNLSIKWRLDSPQGSFAALEATAMPTVQFEPDMAGIFTLHLRVEDGKGGGDSAEQTITASLPIPDALPSFTSTPPPEPHIKDRLDAVRLLYQATFGPRDGDIDSLIQKGVKQWFAAQIDAEPHFYTRAWESIAEEFNDIDSGENANFRQLSHETFMVNALSSPDQLRQRVTYALSQLFVISDRFDFAGHDRLIMGYADTLHRHAFGNYRDLLRDVTLHPAMGMYLAMLGNEKANPEKNIRPDENFAREVMQLFTVGLQLLNQDGSPILDDEQLPRQTYSPVNVQNYAAAFTGWYFADQEAYKFGDTFHSIEWDARLAPMTAYEGFHQKTQKKLLRNYYVPANASAEESLETALDSLFYHPNLGPFIARHLIKHFVTSNPSPSYIGRVAAVFNSNAHGERGNLASVIQAILFDSEARLSASGQTESFGKAKDPLLKYVNFSRLFTVSSYRDNRLFLGNRPSQTFLGAQSVFNFFSPTHTPNKLFADQSLVAPELQVITPETIVSDASLYAYISTREQLDYWHENDTSESTQKHLNSALTHDLSPLVDRLEASDLSAVIDFLDEYMAQGRLSAQAKTELFQHFGPQLQQLRSANYYNSEPHRRADIHSLLVRLIYQVSITPEYSMQW